MDYRDIESSGITRVGYEPSSATLAICFRNGAEYHYSPVPMELYDGLLRASSVRRYFHENVRNAGYHSRRIEAL